MIDTSDDAIEADLERATRGGPAAPTWLAWAQVRATLAGRTASEATGRPAFLALPTEASSPDIQIAEGPFGDSYAVPATAAWVDRVEAAARMLGLEADALTGLLAAAFGPKGAPIVPDLVPPAEPDFELDIDDEDGGLEDAFTEAGGTIEDLEKADSIDADFFADERKARDR